jgi:hypothetical protein
MTGIKWFPFFSLKPLFTPLFHHLFSSIRNPFKSITIHQFTNQKGTTKMKKSEIRELKKVVRVDKSHIKEFLKVHKFDLHNNRVSYLFKEADLQMEDSQSIIQFNFRNLWEVEEPEKVRVEFTIVMKSRNQMERWLDIQDNLTNKVVGRGWPDNPVNPQDYLTDCSDVCEHHREVSLNVKGKLMKVTIIANLCYCG